MTITVSRLRELLSQYPDDMLVNIDLIQDSSPYKLREDLVTTYKGELHLGNYDFIVLYHDEMKRYSDLVYNGLCKSDEALELREKLDVIGEWSTELGRLDLDIRLKELDL